MEVEAGNIEWERWSECYVTVPCTLEYVHDCVSGVTMSVSSES